VFEELRRIQPQNVEHLLGLSRLHQGLQDMVAAEMNLKEAVEMAPEDPRALSALAGLYLSTGQHLAEAPRLAERLIRLQPTAEHYFLFSTACMANGDRAGAQAALQEARRQDPQNPVYLRAARALEKE
jgi:Tfp pilus assembly protein PilF